MRGNMSKLYDWFLLQSCPGIHNIIYPLVEVIFPNKVDMCLTTHKVTTSLLKMTRHSHMVMSCCQGEPCNKYVVMLLKYLQIMEHWQETQNVTTIFAILSSAMNAS